MFGVFGRRNNDANHRRVRMETKQIYEDECNRLINNVEHLTRQRKESVEIIRLVNTGLGDLITNLQKKNPQNGKVKPIPDELLNNASAQLLNFIQENSIQAQLDGELLDDDSDSFILDNTNDIDGNDGECIRKCNDDGLKTELVILQSQMNRLRTEQDKLTVKLDNKQPKTTNSNGESSHQIHKRRVSTGLIDSFDLSKEIDSDSGDDINERLKKQEKEINRLRQKIKIYEDQFKEYNGTSSHVNGLANGIDGINGTNKEIKDEFKKLQRSFHTFTRVSDEVEINQDAANDLLESYKLGSFQDNIKPSRARLAATLEARVLSLLKEQVDGYFADAVKDTYLEEDYDDNNLEFDLVNTIEKLVELVNRFADSRVNEDESLKTTCTKLRSQIYSSLSISTFSNPDSTHPFITSLISQLLKFMEEYRTPSSMDSIQAREEAKQVVLGFISLAYFKLKSLDPQPRLFYYDQGTNVDENKMKGNWDKTNVSNQEVEICYFPAVIVNKKDNSIISKAQVLTRER